MILQLPDEDVIMNIHEIVLLVSGGKAGVLNIERVKAAVQRPNTYVQYDNEYDIDTICALLIDSIARGHGFNDGNKRTALMTAIFTYRINDVDFTPSKELNDDFDALVMKVVLDKPEVEDVAKSLRALKAIHQTNPLSWKKFMQIFHNLAERKD